LYIVVCVIQEVFATAHIIAWSILIPLYKYPVFI